MAQPTQRRRIRRSSLKGIARGRLDYLKADLLALGFAPENGLFSEAVTFANATDEVTAATLDSTADHLVIFNTDDTLPDEIEAGVVYRLVFSAATEWSIFEAETNAAVAFTDDGTGTHTVWALS